MLRKWDGNDSRDSAAAAIFEVWFSKHLKAAVLRQQLGESGAKLATPGDNMRILMALADPVVMPLAERNALIISSLRNALDEIAAKLGPDMNAWKWGALHKAVFPHPLESVVAPDQKDRFTVSGLPLGGSSGTPMATTYRTSDFALTSGAS